MFPTSGHGRVSWGWTGGAPRVQAVVGEGEEEPKHPCAEQDQS